jgi:hypothetical protein
MAATHSARSIMGIIIKVLHNKAKVIEVLNHLDARELEAGILVFHQDFLNRTFKMEIMNKVPIEDYEVIFSDGAIQISINKFIKVMMLEKVLKFKVVLSEPDFAFGASGSYFFAKYSLDIEGIPAMIEKMPGGNAIKDTIINNLLKNSIKDMPWIQLMNDRIYMDFSRAPGFEQIKTEGLYGVDLVNTLELSSMTIRESKLKLSYKWND